MKSVDELKQITGSELAKVIHHEVDLERKAREGELSLDFLKRHCDLHKVPECILDSNKIYAVYYTLGGLEALLRIAIMDLQNAESALAALTVKQS